MEEQEVATRREKDAFAARPTNEGVRVESVWCEGVDFED